MSMCNCNQGRLPCSCKLSPDAVELAACREVWEREKPSVPFPDYWAGWSSANERVTQVRDSIQAAWKKSNDAWARERSELQQRVALLEAAVLENHEWHKLYDEHDGYAGSAIEETNTAALAPTSTAYDHRTDLHGYFGLTYASWLTLPRVLLQEMPDRWKRNMAILLNQYEKAFPSQPSYGTTVRVTENGKIIRTPEWLINYRHPDHAMINQVRGVKPADRTNTSGKAHCPHDGICHASDETCSEAVSRIAALKPAVGSTCNQIREESGLPTNSPCEACNNGACIDR